MGEGDEPDLGRALTAVGVIGGVLLWLYIDLRPPLTDEEWLGLVFIACLLAAVGVVFTLRGVIGTLRTLLGWLLDFTGWAAKVIWGLVMIYFFLH